MTQLNDRLHRLRIVDPVAHEEAERNDHEDAVRDDGLARLRAGIHRHVIDNLGPQVLQAQRDGGSDELRGAVEFEIQRAMSTVDGRPLSTGERRMLGAELSDEILGYGPIHQFLRDDSVSEVMVNQFDRIYIERRGKIELTSARFDDDEHLMRIIDRIVNGIGRRIDESSPMVDARLPDGSRVNAIIPPLAVAGPCMTIRKFRREPFLMDDLVASGTLSPRAGQFLQMCVRGEANILVSGGTGSGKTTTLNVLSAAIPGDQRIITVEDAAELQLKQDHVITLESRPSNIEGVGAVTIRDLVINCLRMRPDRIVVGECRGPEAVDMLQAMNTGHDGSMTTLHANSPREALNRLETLVLMSGVELPARAIREQIAGALDLIVQIERLVDGSRRVTHITEVLRMEGDTITLQDLFRARPVEKGTGSEASPGSLLGPLEMTGIKPSFLTKLAANGVKVPATLFGSGARQPAAQRDSRWILRDAGDDKAPTPRKGKPRAGSSPS